MSLSLDVYASSGNVNGMPQLRQQKSVDLRLLLPTVGNPSVVRADMMYCCRACAMMVFVIRAFALASHESDIP